MSKSAKIGQGHARAMGRLGLKELAQILPATPQSIRPIEEPGVCGNATPRDVDKQRHAASFQSRDLYGQDHAPGQQQSKLDHSLDMEMGM